MPDPSIDELSKSDWDDATAAEQTAIREQCERGSSTGWTQLSDARKNELIREAIAERDTLYSERMARLPTLDGDAETFTLNLARHKWELAEGGEAQSESGEGGSVSYNTGAGEDYLQQTRYGKTALRYVWTDDSIAIVRSY
ncbi:hypothetical protein M1M40_gp53 [Halorubrum tailed virus 29]|uniref:Uncharacterized protein n=1 Tax=Halorubrum tailed virus 29 TaxID=2878010 RepID=A0AAE8Y0R4_9CAUD|nr:hypothetical protein M1M40_gp53 [Halorubrum tailed virus 29]UBF23331.1 hypothetical protein HRTV-29_gp53 [Halorubrum tailed virus 29]